jgi:hypothetical protein
VTVYTCLAISSVLAALPVSAGSLSASGSGSFPLALRSGFSWARPAVAKDARSKTRLKRSVWISDPLLIL